MARIKIELEDTEDGGMNFKIDADGLATFATVKTNTTVQNSAILLIEVLKECGIDKGQLPDLVGKKKLKPNAVSAQGGHAVLPAVERRVSRPCPGCGAMACEQHADGCDVERCPDCGGQMISCDCEGDIEMPRLPWGGEWPGVMECREYGWYAKLIRGRGWVSCSKDEAGASENLSRLARDATWSKEQGRFILHANAMFSGPRR